MVRAWVAFACGLRAVSSFASNTAVVTPRRPSSMASMSPKGPPPAMTTWQCAGNTKNIVALHASSENPNHGIQGNAHAPDSARGLAALPRVRRQPGPILARETGADHGRRLAWRRHGHHRAHAGGKIPGRSGPALRRRESSGRGEYHRGGPDRES